MNTKNNTLYRIEFIDAVILVSASGKRGEKNLNLINVYCHSEHKRKVRF